MSSAAYALKILLLQTQLDVDAKIFKGSKLFDYFVAVIYAKHWFEAPVETEAAANDLHLYKLLLAHKDISIAALSALKTSLLFE